MREFSFVMILTLLMLGFSDSAKSQDLDDDTVKALRMAAKKAGARLIFVVDPPKEAPVAKTPTQHERSPASTAGVPAMESKAVRQPPSDGCRLVDTRGGQLFECKE